MSSASAESFAPPPPGKYRLSVSAYDRSSSMLIALLVLVGMTVVGLLIVYLTMQLMQRQLARPVEILERAAGAPDAQGSSDTLDPPQVEEAPELQEPQLPEMLNALADLIHSDDAVLDRQTVQATAAPSAGEGEGDPRRAGNFGTGDVDRIPRWERWRIRYQDPRSLERYAAQLDFFRIELAMLGADNKVYYAFNLSQEKPDRRVGEPLQERRIRFTWQAGPLRRADIRLLRRAGWDPSGRPVVQCIPPEMEAQLLRLEAEASAGRDVDEIRATVFAVKNVNDGFALEVVEQTFF